MMIPVRSCAIATLLALCAAAPAALAQEEPAERSRFVRFLEGMLSTPDRQVALYGLQGAFSSNPSVDQVTVSDAQGVWMTIDDLAVTWNRTALFRRILDIETLTAARVEVLREPVAGDVQGEPSSFSSPVDIEVETFSLPAIVLAEPFLGAAANLSAAGSASLDSEALAADLTLTRLDEPGGSLAATLRLEPDANELTAEISYSEPAGGLVADWLNLPGRPALAFQLDGSGSLSDWQAEMRLAANDVEALAGTIGVARSEAGTRITADLNGAIEPIVPDAYAALLAGQSELDFDVTRNEDGSILLRSATLRSQGADVAASGQLTADLFPRNAEITVRLGQAGRTGLPFVPGDVSVSRLELTAGLDEGEAAPWRAEISAEGVQSQWGAATSVTVQASGQASNLTEPAERATSFELEGSASGVAAADPDLAEALGSSVQVSGAGAWASGQPTTIEALNLILTGATASFAGSASAERLEGRYTAQATDLSRFSALAGRPLSGAASLQATGPFNIEPATFDFRLEGTADDLGIGVPALDAILAGRTELAGGVRRAQTAIEFADLTVTNEQVRAVVSGTVEEPEIDLTFEAQVAELSTLTPRASGAARLSGRLSGTQDAPQIEVEATGEEVVLMGRPLVDPLARFTGTIAGPQTSGQASLQAVLGGVPVDGSARLAAGENGARLLQDLMLRVGRSRAEGDLAIGADGLLSGNLTVASPDVAAVAPLFLVEASGGLEGEVTLSAEGGSQSARFSGTATDFRYETVSVESADIRAVAESLFTAPQIEGEFAVRNLQAGGLTVLAATGTARRVGPSTAFSVEAELADGDASLVGTLDPLPGGFAVALDALSFRRPGVDLRLAAPTTIPVRNGTAEFQGATVLVGSGRATISGRAGEQLALTVELAAIPAQLVNSFAPDLGAEGLVAGTLTVTGTAADPTASFDATWQNASVEATRNAGLGPLAVAAEGSLVDGAIALDSTISGAGGLTLDVGGRIGLEAGSGLDLQVTGDVPLALGNRGLADRGAVLQGALSVDVAVTGTLADPQFSGSITADGGGFVDPETGIVLTDLTLRSTISNDQLVVEQLTAQSGGGTVSASGTVGLDLAAGFPVDLSATIRDARYVDGTLVAATFDADLTLSGSLTRQPLLGGTVTIEEANITVPEKLPRGSVAVEVMHLYAPPPVEATLARARLDTGEGDGGDGGEPSGIRLAVTIDAPARIFVRGRGLDAELGGQLSLVGPVSDIVAQGAFEMRRGRLDIFTQRITFDRGVLTFAGDLDPILDFTGTTQSGDLTVTITVSGRASDPDVDFSSDPELPPDEVLARLLFNRSVAELSPVQLARLAAAAAQYAGGSGGGGLLGRLRESTGLDDLDIVTDESGGLALQAGRYISENVYLGFQQGATSESTRVTIELDITEDIKARAAVSPQGSSSIGVFYEREY